MNFALFCKTYINDLERFKILKKSIDKFNIENIPLFIICPKEDIKIFSSLITKKEKYKIYIFSDEEILSMTENHKQSWHTQQLVKMYFYRMNLCNFYLIIDSDSYFIKEFRESDFMYSKNTPYIVMHENKSFNDICQMLGSENVDKMALVVKNYFKRKGKDYRFLTTPLIFSSEVLRAMDNKISFEKLLELSPLEAYWHGEFILSSNVINFKPCEPFFKCFNYQFEYNFYRKNGMTEVDIAKNHLGIVMQDGWVKDDIYKTSIFHKIKKKFKQIGFHLNSDTRHVKKINLKFYIKFYIISVIKILFK